MDVHILRNACLDAMDQGQCIILVTKSTRLCGKRGPIGELRCVNAKGEKVVEFDAEKVLKFIDRELSR